MPSCNAQELMICVAARLLEDNAMVVVGTGAPCAAAMLAQMTAAPGLTLMFEAGGVGPRLPRMPISVGDSRTFYQGLMATSMNDVMETCQRGLVDYTFLGGAQIDVYGNLNSTMIGEDYQQPRVRLPGSGGANDLGSLCRRILVLTPHDRRRFVERVPRGTGPHKVVTNLAVLGFDQDSKRMCVEALHPEVSLEEVRANTGFELLVSPELSETPPPSDQELEILRERVDPQGYIIGRS